MRGNWSDDRAESPDARRAGRVTRRRLCAVVADTCAVVRRPGEADEAGAIWSGVRESAGPNVLPAAGAGSIATAGRPGRKVRGMAARAELQTAPG